MAKQQINLRFSQEADRAANRLCADHGYDSRTDAIEASVACWEIALTLASRSVESKFTRPEWNMIADVCNGTLWAYGHTGSNPGTLLAAEVSDGHRLDGTGYRWFCDTDALVIPADQRANADTAVSDLVWKLNALEYVEAWAVIRSICWFWQHNDIDFTVDEWWTLEFRQTYRVPVD